MRNTKDLLKQQISQLAIDACRKMGKRETQKFFKDCPTVSRCYSNVVRKRKYGKRTIGRYKKSGKPKEVWEVDAKLFEKLWFKVKSYAGISAYESLKRHQDVYSEDALEDLMSDIMFGLYKCLKFHGPTPNGCGFSKKIPVIVSNILRNAHSKRSGVRKRVVVRDSLRKKGPYKKNSPIEYPVITPLSKIEDAETLFFSRDDMLMEKTDLMVSVPENLKKALELLLGNATLSYTARELGLGSSFQLREQLREVFSELVEVS